MAAQHLPVALRAVIQEQLLPGFGRAPTSRRVQRVVQIGPTRGETLFGQSVKRDVLGRATTAVCAAAANRTAVGGRRCDTAPTSPFEPTRAATRGMIHTSKRAPARPRTAWQLQPYGPDLTT